MNFATAAAGFRFLGGFLGGPFFLVSDAARVRVCVTRGKDENFGVIRAVRGETDSAGLYSPRGSL